MTQIAIIWTKVTSGQLSNQSNTPRRRLSYYQYLANIFILPIFGKYCKFYQYWEGLRRKAICRSQKLRQHILSIAFLSLLMSSAVRNCPWYMMFYLSRISRWHCPPLSSCSSLQVSIIYGVLHKFHDIVHLFPAACLPCNLGAATEVVATAGAWRGLLFRGIRGSGIFRIMWSGLRFFFVSFILFILENRPSMIVRPPVRVDTRLRWYFLTFQSVIIL